MTNYWKFFLAFTGAFLSALAVQVGADGFQPTDILAALAVAAGAGGVTLVGPANEPN
jgi:hypothetical protein